MRSLLCHLLLVLFSFCTCATSWAQIGVQRAKNKRFVPDTTLAKQRGAASIDSIYGLGQRHAYFAGAFSIQSSVLRPASSPRQQQYGSYSFAFNPRIGLFFSRQVAAGVQLQFGLSQVEQAPTPGATPASKVRITSRKGIFLPEFSLNQSVVPNLYIYQQLALGLGRSSSSLSLLDAGGRSVAQQNYGTTIALIDVRVGAYYFFVPRLALDGSISYRIASEKAESFGAVANLLQPYIPSGRYNSRSIALQLGLLYFLPPHKGAAKSSPSQPQP